MFGCCCNVDQDIRLESSELRLRRKTEDKIRPLLCDLDAQFKEFCGPDNKLDKAELTEIWKKVAARKVGKLSKEDEQLIDQSCSVYFKEMDVDATGSVTYEEFVAFMLGAEESHNGIEAKKFRDGINQKLQQDPQSLERLIKQFKTWDKNGDGKVTKEELDAVLQDMHASQKSEQDIDKIQNIRDHLFESVDMDDNGSVDLFEVMAYMLGRRKAPVEVLMYDVSKGFTKKWSKILMGKTIQAVHTGVLVYNSEYWCGGKIYRSEPPCTKCFGEPLVEYSKTEPLETSEQRPDLKVIKLGYTLVTHDEFVKWMATNIIPRYDREKYDLLTHSCNHYTNEAVTFLTGNSLPDRIFDLQKAFLTPTLISMRPFLNKYMCCFGDSEKEIDRSCGFAVDYMPEDRQEEHTELISEVLGTGEVVILKGLEGLEKHDHVVGTITGKGKKKDKFDVTYFDPVQEKIVKKKDVDAMKITRV